MMSYERELKDKNFNSQEEVIKGSQNSLLGNEFEQRYALMLGMDLLKKSTRRLWEGMGPDP